MTKKEEFKLQEAYKLVLDDLMNCRLYRGCYDAEHGKVEFMNGIWSVMESISIRTGDEGYYEKFLETFSKNLHNSLDRAKKT